MSNIDFTLRGLDTEVSLTVTPEYPEVPITSAILHHYVIKQDISAADLNNIFWFKTTDPDLTTTEGVDDMAFAVIKENWVKGIDGVGTNSVDFSFSDTVPADGRDQGGVNALSEEIGTYVKNSFLKEIGVSRLARQITGGYNNSDIFVNESELVAQYVTLDASVNTTIRNEKLGNGGTFASPLANDSSGHTNITRELVNYCLGSDNADIVHRVHDMIVDASNNRVTYEPYIQNATTGPIADYNAANASNDIWIPFTFKDGDKLMFQLKYRVDNIISGISSSVADNINGQTSAEILGGVAVDSAGDVLGTNNITDQAFLVELTVVGDDASRL
jgi:hypothetical protein